MCSILSSFIIWKIVLKREDRKCMRIQGTKNFLNNIQNWKILKWMVPLCRKNDAVRLPRQVLFYKLKGKPLPGIPTEKMAWLCWLEKVIPSKPWRRRRRRKYLEILYRFNHKTSFQNQKWQINQCLVKWRKYCSCLYNVISGCRSNNELFAHIGRRIKSLEVLPQIY